MRRLCAATSPAKSSTTTHDAFRLRCLRDRLPLEKHTDIAGHATRKVENFHAELVAKRTQFLVIVLVCLLREALERSWPIRLVIVDSAAAIVAIGGRKSNDAELVVALLGRSPD